MFSSTIFVCFSTVTSGISPVRRSVGVRPDTKTKLPARSTGLSGMPSFFRCQLTPGTSMTYFLTFFMSVLVEHLLDRFALPRYREREHEKDARLLRHEVVADDEPRGLELRRDDDAAVPGTRGEHHR